MSYPEKYEKRKSKAEYANHFRHRALTWKRSVMKFVSLIPNYLEQTQIAFLQEFEKS